MGYVPRRSQRLRSGNQVNNRPPVHPYRKNSGEILYYLTAFSYLYQLTDSKTIAITILHYFMHYQANKQFFSNDCYLRQNVRLKITHATIPRTIAKLMYIDKTNSITPSPPIQCCKQPRNNFW